MGIGLQTALGEITLVLFTTLAPSGAVAFAIMGLPVVRGGLDAHEHARIDKFLSIPIVVTMAGLVASATHLGNPANALYVFLGVGRSPLSTEAFCAVVFLMLAGMYWLYSFAERPNRAAQRILMVASIVAGAAFVASVAFAYDVETIVSWSTVHVPLSVWLNAFLGGPLLAIVGLRAAGCASVEGRAGRALLALAVVALAGCIALYALQAAQLPSIENSFATAADLVPQYGLMIGAFAILAAAGVAVDAKPLLARDRTTHAASAGGPGFRAGIVRATCASLLAFAGIFVMRFAFYMMHMTVGLGL